MSKIIGKSKHSEWAGLVRIRQVVSLEMKCIYRETSSDDFGIDGTIEMSVPTADGQGMTKGGIVNFQSKAGKKYVTADSEDGFATPVELKDIEYWVSSNVPVIFIVFHPADDCLYYVDIQEYVRKNPGIYAKPHKILFDKSQNIFDKDAYLELCRLADTTPPPVDFTQGERLFCNLFPVTWHTRVFTSAATDYISREEIFYDFNAKTESEEKFRLPPFFLFENRIYTLADLRDPVNLLRDFCDSSTISDHDVYSWLEVNDENELDRNFGGRDEFEDLDFVRERDSTEIYTRRDRQRRTHALRSNVINLFNQLLGKHLAERGLEYNRDFKRSYFPRKNQTDLEFTREWTSIRTGAKDKRAVCKFYDQYGSLRFWRHEALSAGFRVFGDRVFLEIEPKLLFTEDGETPCASEMVGPYSTKYKTRRFNSQVLNDVLFWAHVFGARKGRDIEMKVGSQTLIKISSEPVIFNADFSIAQTTPTKRAARRVSRSEPNLFGGDPDGETSFSNNKNNGKIKQNTVVRENQSKVKTTVAPPSRRAKPRVSGKQNGKKAVQRSSVKTGRK